MKSKLFKRIIALASAVSVFASMTFVLPASAALVREDTWTQTFDEYTAPANAEVIDEPGNETNKILKVKQGASINFSEFPGVSDGDVQFEMDVNFPVALTGGTADKNTNGAAFVFGKAGSTAIKVQGATSGTKVPLGWVYGGGGGQNGKAGDLDMDRWYTILATIKDCNKGSGTISFKVYDRDEYTEKKTAANAVASQGEMGFRNSQVPNQLIVQLSAGGADEYFYIDNLTAFREVDPDAANELKDVEFKTTPGVTIIPPEGDGEVKDFPVELKLTGTKSDEPFTEENCDSIVWTHKGTETDDGYVGWNFDDGKASGSIEIKNGVSTYYCILTATVTQGDTVISRDYKFVINPSVSVAGQLYPDGYPTDWNIYPDSLVGYTITNGAIGDVDPLIAHWASVGSNGARTLTFKKDDNGNKYLELDSHGGSGSTTSGITVGATSSQMIFEFEVLPTSGSSFVYASSTPNNSAKNYRSAFELSFDGSKVNTGTTRSNPENTAASYTGGTKSIEGVAADGNIWYKVIASYDKSIQQYYVKLYDMNGKFIGDTGMQASDEEASPSVFSMNGSPVGIRNVRIYTPTVKSMTINTAAEAIRVPEEDGAEPETLDLSAEMMTADGLEATGEVTWSFEDGEVANALIESTGPQTATLTVSQGAASGDVVIVATRGAAQAKKTIRFITSANNVAFTKSVSSVTIPFDGEDDVVNEFKAETRTGNGDPIEGEDVITYKLLNSTGTSEANIKGVTFEDGVLTVEAGASPAMVYVQAENAEGLTNRVKVNIHGMTFAFGTDEPEEGYTAVKASTVYNDNAGYGFESIEGLTDTEATDATPSNVTGTSAYTMKVKVPNGNYTVTVSTTSKSMLSEAVSGSATGISKSGSSFKVAVCDGILDLTFNENSSISTLQISQIAVNPSGSKPAIYSIGDSTTNNSGHYSNYNTDKAAQAADPTKWVDERVYASWGNCVTQNMYSDVFSAYSNHGMAGRNSANYYVQARLEAVLLAVAPGDYVTINMGINGESGEPYEKLMEYYYVQGVIQRGAVPVILSHTPDGPNLSNGGSYSEANGFNVSRAADGRVKFLKSLAEKYDLEYIDVGTWGENYFNSLTTDDLDKANTANSVNVGYKAPEKVIDIVQSWYPDHNHYTKELGDLIAEYIIDSLKEIATAEKYTVTFEGENAAVTVGGQVVTSKIVREGKSVKFTVTPAADYLVTEVKAGDTVLEAVDGVYTLPNVSADTTVTITTVFDDRATYTVTFEGENASAAVNGKTVTSTDVKEGDSISFTVTPAEGYEIVEVKAGETALEAVDGVYTIESVTEDITVTITVKENSEVSEWIKYEATYDEGGALENVEITYNAIPQVEENTDVHRIFYWDANMRPWVVANPAE
ncbi:MAG: hypothetical protein J1F64_01880 [Oscillospiraceae bacterium]|nr:hypothetical protein [Oscillospiraceae bacterium]